MVADAVEFVLGPSVTVARENDDGLMQCVLCPATFVATTGFASRYELEDRWADPRVQDNFERVKRHYLSEHSLPGDAAS